jgi:hypothetical protein
MKPFLTPLAAMIVATTVYAQNAPAQEAQMRPLFNGKDLTGWTGEGYIVEDGAIVCTPQGTNLMTTATFSNYVLDFEFKLPPGGNNGLGIHYPGEGDGAYTGMELQILDNSAPQYKDLKDYQYHGSLYTLAAAARTGLKKAGEWNRQRVSVLGPAIHVELNGETILRANLDDLQKEHPDHAGVKRRSGHIAWLGHGDRVAFRNIQIAEVAPAANVAGVTEAGFVRLFDGTSLNGWKHTADTKNWTVHNGILKHDGTTGPVNDLWTEKEYGDLTLVFDWRWSGRGRKLQQPVVLPDGSHTETAEVEELDSGIYLRGNTKSQVNLWNWTVGSGEVYGYRTDGSQPAEVRAGVTPSEKADRPLGEWNRTMITIQGDRLSVTINGKNVIKNAQLPGVPERGAVGLQHHGAAIDFANIWIKEL